MRPSTSKTTHEKLISFAVNHLNAERYSSICADHIPGFPQPQKISWSNGVGHIPDITATDAQQKLIFEVETPESILSEHTESQLILFAAFAHQHNRVFWLIVPGAISQVAERVLRNLNITNAKIWAAGGFS